MGDERRTQWKEKKIIQYNRQQKQRGKERERIRRVLSSVGAEGGMVGKYLGLREVDRNCELRKALVRRSEKRRVKEKTGKKYPIFPLSS